MANPRDEETLESPEVRPRAALTAAARDVRPRLVASFGGRRGVPGHRGSWTLATADDLRGALGHHVRHPLTGLEEGRRPGARPRAVASRSAPTQPDAYA